MSELGKRHSVYAYIKKGTKIARTIPYDPKTGHVIFDVDKDGDIVGVEILGAQSVSIDGEVKTHNVKEVVKKAS